MGQLYRLRHACQLMRRKFVEDFLYKDKPRPHTDARLCSAHALAH